MDQRARVIISNLSTYLVELGFILDDDHVSLAEVIRIKGLLEDATKMLDTLIDLEIAKALNEGKRNE